MVIRIAVIEGFDAEENTAIHRALDAISAFVRRVGFGENSSLRPPVFYAQRGFLALDPRSRMHLELTRALGQNEKATLLATLDRTRTAMGSRMLARWLLAPLVERERIERRADAVEALVRDPLAARGACDRPRRLLRHRADRAESALAARAAARSRVAAANARVRGSGSRRACRAEPARESARLRRCDRRFRRAGRRPRATLVDDPPATLADGGVIRPASDPELAETVSLRTDARSRIAALEERERERTGIRSLRIKYASAFGYAIEVSKSNLGAVPADYVRRQTLVGGERFVTPELRELDLAIANAQTRQRQREAELYEALVERVAARVDELLRAADALAEIDATCSLAQVAAERGYVRPQFVDESRIEVHAGRHPVMEAILGSGFVPERLAARDGQRRDSSS